MQKIETRARMEEERRKKEINRDSAAYKRSLVLFVCHVHPCLIVFHEICVSVCVSPESDNSIAAYNRNKVPSCLVPTTESPGLLR